jgi:glycosyltransferase involved in cell wall biosynthesis
MFVKLAVVLDGLPKMKETGGLAPWPVSPSGGNDIVESGASVAILLCTFNGARFLPEQLQSFKCQQFANWHLVASDDGSSDRTKEILSAFRQENLGRRTVEIKDGPGGGVVRNFLSLACDERIDADYFAFSDQDDIWEPEKLQIAVAWLKTRPDNVPALYCSRTRLIDERNSSHGMSPLFRLKPSFRNAIVQSIAGGNTMVFNRAARNLLISCGADVQVPMHDWWIYMVVSAGGGDIVYDRFPKVRYRVHAANVIGSNKSWRSQRTRMQMLLHGRFRDWSALNIAALKRLRSHMTAESRRTFDLFCRGRDENMLKRFVYFFRAGIYRQTLLGNIGLLAAIFMKRI